MEITAVAGADIITPLRLIPRLALLSPGDFPIDFVCSKPDTGIMHL
jgi:hypothetical protein